MEIWTEIRRKVLVEGASKRSILRDYKVSTGVLEKILSHAEPPGYRQSVVRPKPQLGGFIAVIEQILAGDKTAPPKQRHTAKRIFEQPRGVRPAQPPARTGPVPIFDRRALPF
jgi:hypothetical protein